MAICNECGGLIDHFTHACIFCGLEAFDVEERRLVNQTGEKDPRLNDASLRKNKVPGARGFRCMVCAEWFNKEDERFAMENFGFSAQQQPGSNLAYFNSRQELKEHTKFVHGSQRLGWSSTHRLKPEKGRLIKE